jgi:predicted dienelactone hydrolase
VKPAVELRSLRRRQLNAMLLGSAIPWTAWATAPAAAPRYEVFDFDWVDTSRARPVPSRLYWPAGPAPGAGVPLVVFSHGIGGSRQGYSYLGKHWSSHGVASLHVQHVGSDASLWRGNPFGVVGRLQAAAREGEAVARAGDLRFALDRMLSDATSGLGAAVDLRRLVAAGHSYGANTTLLAVGAQVIRQGALVDCRDPRFAAAIVISAPPFYGEADLAAVLGPVAVPTVHITATDDVIEIPGYRSAAADRLAVFDAVGDPRKLLAVFRGGSHSIFTDRFFTGGTELNPKVKAATAELSLAFLDFAFRGDAQGLRRWRAAWQPILAATPGSGFPAQETEPG